MGSCSYLTLDDRLNGIVKDSPDILYKLNQIEINEDSTIEIVTELPAAVDPYILLSYVSRWREIQKHFGKELRVYAWSYTMEVEKYVLLLVQNIEKLSVTVLPMYLKENKRYGE